VLLAPAISISLRECRISAARLSQLPKSTSSLSLTRCSFSSDGDDFQLDVRDTALSASLSKLSLQTLEYIEGGAGSTLLAAVPAGLHRLILCLCEADFAPAVHERFVMPSEAEMPAIWSRLSPTLQQLVIPSRDCSCVNALPMSFFQWRWSQLQVLFVPPQSLYHAITHSFSGSVVLFSDALPNLRSLGTVDLCPSGAQSRSPKCWFFDALPYPGTVGGKARSAFAKLERLYLDVNCPGYSTHSSDSREWNNRYEAGCHLSTIVTNLITYTPWVKHLDIEYYEEGHVPLNQVAQLIAPLQLPCMPGCELRTVQFLRNSVNAQGFFDNADEPLSELAATDLFRRFLPGMHVRVRYSCPESDPEFPEWGVSPCVLPMHPTVSSSL